LGLFIWITDQAPLEDKMIQKPIEAEKLNHDAKHGRRYKGLSWEDTARISSYITSLEYELTIRSNGVANNVINPTAPQ
jgi:hypothetical protein